MSTSWPNDVLIHVSTHKDHSFAAKNIFSQVQQLQSAVFFACWSWCNLIINEVILLKFADGKCCWLCLFIKSATECFTAIIKDGQLLLVSGPNSFGSNYGWLPVSHFNMIINILFTSCHTTINHLYRTMQLSKFSAVADYLPGRQFLYVDRSTMKHDTSQCYLSCMLNVMLEAQSYHLT